MHILLLDMDGVLLEPRGYHHALQKTVKIWGRALGYEDVFLPLEIIHNFESVGLTSEWDSASVCVALMLLERWAEEPHFPMPASPMSAAKGNRRLDISIAGEFLSKLDGQESNADLIRRVERLLTSGLAEQQQIETIRALLRDARYIHRSNVHRTQQEYVLGSDQMMELYGLEPYFDVTGTLLQDDRPTLSEGDRSSLIKWLNAPNRAAVAFTNRPCRPPEGHFDTPEAEMGLRVAGLDSLKIIGSGTMGWLSALRGEPLYRYLKPSKAHALTAILTAAGMDTKSALSFAVGHQIDQNSAEILQKMLGARVDVFEDSTNGLQSALGAKESLQAMGVDIALYLHGIANNERKKKVLAKVGARLYSSLSDALQVLPEFPSGRLHSV